MGSSSGDELSQWDVQSSNGHDERIIVSVRLRPLNDRETARNDVSDWECINNSTIIYKNHIAERSLFPAAYTFGKHLLRLSFWYNSFDFPLLWSFCLRWCSGSRQSVWVRQFHEAGVRGRSQRSYPVSCQRHKWSVFISSLVFLSFCLKFHRHTNWKNSSPETRFFQRLFLPTGRQAVARRTPCLELLNIQWPISSTT